MQIVLALRDRPELAIINLDTAESKPITGSARRDRPRRRAADKRDEVAPFQLIKLHSSPPARAALQDIEASHKAAPPPSCHQTSPNLSCWRYRT